MGRVTEKMSAEASSQLYVRNLPWEVDSSGLQEIFEGYGTITECTIPVQKGSDRSRGFGYVTFARAEDAAKALEAMAGATVGDGESAREIGVALVSLLLHPVLPYNNCIHSFGSATDTRTECIGETKARGQTGSSWQERASCGSWQERASCGSWQERASCSSCQERASCSSCQECEFRQGTRPREGEGWLGDGQEGRPHQPDAEAV